jgi:hypothetical protein
MYVTRCHCLFLSQMDDERELIKMILRYIGVLHDVKATEKSIAAGGRDSVKDSVPPPLPLPPFFFSRMCGKFVCRPLPCTLYTCLSQQPLISVNLSLCFRRPGCLTSTAHTRRPPRLSSRPRFPLVCS